MNNDEEIIYKTLKNEVKDTKNQKEIIVTNKFERHDVRISKRGNIEH